MGLLLASAEVRSSEEGLVALPRGQEPVVRVAVGSTSVPPHSCPRMPSRPTQKATLPASGKLSARW